MWLWLYSTVYDSQNFDQVYLKMAWVKLFLTHVHSSQIVLELYRSTLNRAAILINVAMQLEVLYDFSGDQQERGRLYVMPRP
jgi:hypothetical protein